MRGSRRVVKISHIVLNRSTLMKVFRTTAGAKVGPLEGNRDGGWSRHAAFVLSDFLKWESFCTLARTEIS